jgi:cysteinyl-tRNA synthetase
MNPLTSTQEQSLVSYSEQRDALVNEVRDLGQQRDTTNSQVMDLGRTKLQLLHEISAAQEDLDNFVGGVDSQKSAKKAELDQLIKDFDAKKVEKALVEDGLQKSADFLEKVNEALKETLAIAGAIATFVETTKKDLYDNANTVANSAASVSRATQEVTNIVETFMNTIIAKSEENLKKEQELNVFKAALDDRKEAIDLLYSEIVAKMKKDGKNLAELNKVA